MKPVMYDEAEAQVAKVLEAKAQDAKALCLFEAYERVLTKLRTPVKKRSRLGFLMAHVSRIIPKECQ